MMALQQLGPNITSWPVLVRGNECEQQDDDVVDTKLLYFRIRVIIFHKRLFRFRPSPIQIFLWALVGVSRRSWVE